MATNNLAARIALLKEASAEAQRLAGQAGSAIEFARTSLAQIDAELSGMGINPENAEAELDALESQLDVTTTDLETKLQAETAELNRIMGLARQAQLVR